MKQKTPRPLHKANEQGIKKGRISIYFLFCDNLIIPASVKVIHSVSKNYQESCRDQYNTDYNGNGIDCTGKSKVAL